MGLVFENSELKKFAGVSASLSLDSLQPYLEHSKADREVKRILTDTLYNELEALVMAGTINEAGNAKFLKLLPYAQSVLVKYAVYDYIKEGHAKISDAGLTVANADKKAEWWQQIELKKSYVEKIYFAVEDLLRYLISQKAEFTTWAESSSYSQGLAFIFNTAEDFQRYVNISESYRTLVALRPAMQSVENGALKNLLSPTLFGELKTAIKNQTTTPAQKSLLEYVEPAVANMTVAMAIQDLNLQLSADGAFIHSIDHFEKKDSPRAAQLRESALRYGAEGSKCLEELRQFLNATASATLYAGYFNSTNYESLEEIDRSPNPDRNSYNTMA